LRKSLWQTASSPPEIAAVIEALHKIRYDGPLCAEVIPLPDDETAARQHVEFVRANW